MDRLRAYILILHAKVERERLRRRIADLERQQASRHMTPNVRGAVGAVAKLRHAADERAKILIERVGAADTRDAAAHKAVHGQLDELEKATAEMEQLSSDLAGSNGGPTLDGSGQPLPEPQKSWSGGGQG